MKIIEAFITPMPRPMPQGMFDAMPEVIAIFEDGRTLHSFGGRVDFFSIKTNTAHPNKIHKIPHPRLLCSSVHEYTKPAPPGSSGDAGHTSKC